MSTLGHGRASPLPRADPRHTSPVGTAVEALIARAAKGDHDAFAQLYDRVCAQVHGLVRRVLRDPAQADEVTQEVLLEVWRTATRFDPARGGGITWILTIAHRRAVDRVRSEQASRDRIERVAAGQHERDVDVVVEAVDLRLEQQQVRKALDDLTDLQREALELAYYGGYTYREVADLLDAPLGTVKTRLRDGLIRLRDALGVNA